MLVLLIGGVIDLVIVELHASGRPTDMLAVFFLAGSALLNGAVLLYTGARDREDRFRLYLGVGVTLLGVGYAAIAAAQIWFGSPPPNLGNLVQLLSIPWVAAALWTLVRGNLEPAAGLRFGVEVVMLGAALSILWWRALILVGRPGWEPAAGQIFFNIATLTVFAMVLVALTRVLSVAVVLASVGAFGIACTDPIRMLLVAAGVDPVFGLLGATTSWTLATIGLLIISAAPPDLGERELARAERRRSIIVSTVAYVLVLMAGGLTVRDGTVDGLTYALFLTVLGSLWLREVIRAGQLDRTLGAMRQLAHRDPLTGLGNRRALEDTLRSSRRGDGVLSLLMIDLDGFKAVNDQLGHKSGDQLLVRVARVVQSEAERIGADAFRIGGDEFVVIGRNVTPAIEEAGGRIVEGVEMAGIAGGSHALVSVGASAGLVHRELRGQTTVGELLTLLGSASTAMREAKRHGGHGLVFFDERLAGQARRRLLLELRLAKAVADEAVDVRYQPVISVESGYVSGVEAVPRWQDRQLGPVPAAEFIPVAEETGLIRELGHQLLRKAVAGAHETGLFARDLSLSINVSAVQLRMPGFAEDVMTLLREFDAPPRLLTVGMTETVFMRNGDAAVRTLFELARQGVRIALDGFGTGNSSIGYLTQLPVNLLKLDRSLTSRLSEPGVAAITRSVVQMATALSLTVVVEDIRTAQEEALVRGLGVHAAQGRFYCEELTTDQLATLLPGQIDRVG